MVVPSDSSGPVEGEDLLDPVDLTEIDPADLTGLCNPILQRTLKRVLDPGAEDFCAGFQSAI